jgi:hypothetical protein
MNNEDKCHEVPVWETNPVGPFDAWPNHYTVDWAHAIHGSRSGEGGRGTRPGLTIEHRC